MASASYPAKNAAGNSELRAEFARLLQSSAGLEPVTAALKQAAAELSRLGIISFDEREYVRCALPEDRDFPYSNRTCTGRILLDGDVDENGQGYRCPECGRPVYPLRYRKKQFEELRSKVLADGVAKYVRGCLDGFNGQVHAVPNVAAAWRIDVGLAGVHVCVVDYCEQQQLLSLQWAQQNPTCYIALHPRELERFIDVDWVCRTTLADIVDGRIDLPEQLRVLGGNIVPRDVPALATPTFSKGAHRPEVIKTPTETRPTSLTIELGPKSIRINGVDVLAAQAQAALAIVRCLAKVFCEDMLDGKAPDQFRCQTPSDITTALNPAGKTYRTFDDDGARRTINRFQESCENKLRQAGFAVERDSVIQASPNSEKEGYRLNPFRVVLRPRIPTKDEN